MGNSPLQCILAQMLNYRSCSVQKIALILIALLVFLNPKLIWDLYMVDCCWLLCTVQMGWACFTSIKRATANRGHLLTLRSEIERERAKESERDIAYTSPLVFILQSAPLSLIVPCFLSVKLISSVNISFVPPSHIQNDTF